MQVRVGSTDRAFRHGLTARTDGLSVILFPSPMRKACGEKFVNRTKLHNHNCLLRNRLWLRRSVWPTNGPMSGALPPSSWGSDWQSTPCWLDGRWCDLQEPSR